MKTIVIKVGESECRMHSLRRRMSKNKTAVGRYNVPAEINTFWQERQMTIEPMAMNGKLRGELMPFAIMTTSFSASSIARHFKHRGIS